ncbi:MAG: ATP-binding protein [Archaeoglobus sp.]|nr:MAG: ATP-binding protein [Archaeoglobus sp.]
MLPIGTVRSPEGTHEFTFITPDEKRLKTGEFVYYFLDGRKVMCRIVKRKPLRTYPDSFLSYPHIHPSKILKAIGFENETQLFEIKACIMGYYDEKLGFVNPRIPPPPGEAVYLAEEDVIQETLMKKKVGERGSLHIGYLLNREEDVPVTLDASLIASEHICILASTGSGKSYLSGVIVEEFMKPYNKASLLVLDPHGEYHTLKEIEGLKEFRDGSYRPRVRIFGKGEIKIRLCELDYSELVGILPNLSDKMEAMLKNAYETLPEKFTSQDLIDAIRSVDDENSYTSRALIWRIKRYIQGMDVIDDYVHLELKDLLVPGQLSVLQLYEMSDVEQQILASVLLNRILNARIAAEKGKESNEVLEYPVFIIVEEAHRFASREVRSYEVMRTILSEGRKFGVGVCLISQRPSKIDSDILSQCMTQIVMRIVNPADQDNVKSSVESIGKDLLDELPGLTKGQAIVAGVSINAPVMIRVRDRLTPHGGVSRDAPSEWQKWLSLNESEFGVTENLKNLKRENEDKKRIVKARMTKLFWDE